MVAKRKFVQLFWIESENNMTLVSTLTIVSSTLTSINLGTRIRHRNDQLSRIHSEVETRVDAMANNSPGSRPSEDTTTGGRLSDEGEAYGRSRQVTALFNGVNPAVHESSSGFLRSGKEFKTN